MKSYNSMIQRLDDAKKGVGMQEMLSKTTAADEPKMKKKKRKKKQNNRSLTAQVGVKG